MASKPGVLTAPNYDGVVMIHEETVVEFKVINGFYVVETLPVKPRLERHDIVAMMIPESTTKC